MNLFSENASDQRCPRCAELDLDSIFDPAQFEKLPPLSSPGTVPWTSYVRGLGKFTAQALEAGKMESCGLCSFLQVVASISDNYSVPSALPPYLGPTISKNTAGQQDVKDGEGYTLLALPSHFFAQTSSGIQRLGITAGGGVGSSEAPSRPSKSSAVWLVLIKGGNTLERLVYQTGRGFYPNYPRSLVDALTIYARNTGTWIAEAADEIPHDMELAQIRGRLVRPQRIDYEIIQSWLDFCDARHQSCVPASRKSVPHMKLIDCETRTLVAAEPSMRYMALSYVWGTAPLEKYVYPNLPENLPATVADAMTVARELGIRYLWVDRYCIWQDDKTHKQSQILQMTEIYSDAVVTVAAASGLDPLYGLPGVSRGRKPHSQIVGRVGPRILVSGRIQGRHTEAIERSVWDTRAWTFQEAILSSRILFFSDYEVSLLCSKAECFEHLTHPLDHRNHWGMTKSTYRTSLSTPEGIKSIVWRYSRRKMTFSHDALNAVIGVLSAWSFANDHCYHWWGIPIRFPGSTQRCTDDELREALWNGLCWRLDSGPVKSASRRDGFPSWSWLAVDGRSNVNTTLASGKVSSGAVYRFEVSVAEKGWVEWCDFVRTGGLLSQPFSWNPRLHLEGWVFPIGPICKASFPPQQFYYVTEGDGQPPGSTTGVTDILQFMADLGTAGPDSLANGQLEAISTYAGGDGTESYAIVFERVGGAGRRVGLLDLQVRSLTDRGIPFVVPQRNSNIVQSFGAKQGKIELI